MKNLLLLIVCTLFSSIGYAQVGIGTTAPNAGAALDIVSTDKGILIPRLETTAVSSPTDGMMIYSPMDKSFHYYDGSQWIMIGGGSTVLIDADGDTKIQVEESIDEDLIRFDLKGEEVILMKGDSTGRYRLEFPNNNNNIANGFQALLSNTSGSNNIANGFQALVNNTSGEANIANGINALFYNTEGNFNIANGYQSLFHNTTGSSNIANGLSALISNTTGNNNIANGYQSLYSNTTGINNIANGESTLLFNTTGSNNIAIGAHAGRNNTVSGNTFIGTEAGRNNTTGDRNTFIGISAGRNNITGKENVFQGYLAGHQNTTGSNTFIGSLSGQANTTGTHNTYIGQYSGFNNVSGNNNVFQGFNTGASNTASNNTFIGTGAGQFNTLGSGNVFLGHNAGRSETGSNKLYINNDGGNFTNSLVFGDFADKVLRINGKVGVNTAYTNVDLNVRHRAGNLFTFRVEDPSGIELFYLKPDGDGWMKGSLDENSDRRLKKNIVQITEALDGVKQLAGYRYNWIEKDRSQDKKIGVIAQEVQAIYPELVSQDKKGILSVNYSGLAPILIEAVKEQQAEIEMLEKKIEALEKVQADVLNLKQEMTSLRKLLTTE